MGNQRKKPMLIYSDEYLGYSFYDGHPFNQKRLKITKDLLEKMGYLAPEQILAPRAATNEELCLIHEDIYIDLVKQLGSDTPPSISDTVIESYGLGTEDTPIFSRMHEMTSLIVGGSLLGAEIIMQGKTNHVFNIAGGLHHAFPSKAAGFCIYNDCSIAIAHLRKKYDAKVLYIDIDAHHGDGVQWSFYEDPNVFTFSIHETGRYLFPGTGNITERGDGKGYGYSLNLPLDAFTQDDSWLNCFEEALHEILEFFKPDIIVSQLGCDSHYFDPLTHLSASIKIFATAPQLIKKAADQFCEGKWLATGGGGYDIWRVVPRAWSLVWMVMNEIPVVQQELPPSWLEFWKRLSKIELPTHLFDHEDEMPVIPRKNEIEKQNKAITEKALSFLRNR